jgi:hypothetical protein
MPDAPREEAFYVAYRPLPPGLRPALWSLAIGAVTLLAVMGGLLGATTADPGDAVWSDGRPQQIRGTLVRWPYPMLIPAGDDRPTPWLLVEMGKRGVDRPLDEFDNRAVIISGWTLQRSVHRMIELEPEAAALRHDPDPSVGPAEVRAFGPVTLRGEIVDSKCYLGAMKPGDTRTHKACATLCIRGGIPPMLVERLADGSVRCTLLANDRGGPLGADALPFVAEPVELSGELEVRSGLRRVRVAPGSIRRL